LEQINNTVKTKVTRVSGLIKTKPVGGPPQPDFINGVAEIETSLLPQKLLCVLQDIESDLGRERVIKWGARTMDLDILFYGNEVINDTNLKIPHPLLHLREFVLEPLSELAPKLIHPEFDKSVEELLRALKMK